MNIQDFKKKFEPTLKIILDKKIHQARGFFEDEKLSWYIDYISDFIFSGGKRIRPYCVYLSYKLFWGEEDKEVIRFAAIFEILHSMLLIHDDIIDRADKRHNIKSFHKHLEAVMSKVENKEHIAMSQTIVIWDLMMAQVYDLLGQEYKFEKWQLDQARKNVYSMVQEVILWQMIDIDTMTGKQVTEKCLHKKNLYKTARYTFARPMTIWAILAWSNAKDADLIFKLGESLWLAFQIRDDLKDILAQDQDKTMFSDVQEWQQTYFTYHIMKNWTPKQKKLLKDCMGQELTKGQIKDLQKLFEESGAIAYWRDMIKKHCTEATSTAKKLINFKQEHLDQLNKLIVLIAS